MASSGSGGAGMLTLGALSEMYDGWLCGSGRGGTGGGKGGPR